MLPVLVELREACTHIVHKKLRQFFVGLDDETEEFAMVVVDDIA